MAICKWILLAVIAMATLNQLTSAYKVVCYYPNWAYWRKGIGKLTVQDLDPKLCTHIIYAFVVLDDNTYKIKTHDTYLDITLQYYKKVTDLKQQNSKLKVLVALGGWNDSQGSKYSTLVADPGKRASFISDAKAFVKKYNFDGLDLDWEYPGYGDKAGFSAWVKELHEAFAPEGLEVTAAVSASTDKGYDIAVMNKYLDAIHLMEYDMHGSWEPSTANHHAPLYGTGLSVDSSITSWLNKGAAPNKLIMGIPTYGRSWTLSGSDVTPPAAAQGVAPAGPYTGAAGSLAYFEICSKIKIDGWTKKTDSANKMGPWAYKRPHWVGYDDPAMAKIKAEYIKSKGLGGAMFWDLAMDDFKNTCGGGKNPIISTVRNSLCGSSVVCGSASTSGSTVTTKATGSTTASPTTISTTNISGGKFVCLSNGLFPDPKKCSAYYHCWNNVAYNKLCPNGLYFNPTVKVCDWPQFVNCQASTENATNEVKKPTSVYCDRRTHFQIMCDSQHPSAYYECKKGTLTKKPCPRGTVWSRKYIGCLHPSDPRVGC